MTPVQRLQRDARGATLVEYLVLVAMGAILVIAGARAFGGSIGAKARAKADCVAQLGCTEATEEALHPTRRAVVDAAAAAAAGPAEASSSIVRDFLTGAVFGDFADNAGWSGVAGQVIVGLVPIAGQAADVRDTVAALDSVAQGEPGAGWQVTGALVAWIPGVGDLIKGVFRSGRQVAKKGIGEAFEVGGSQGAKEGPSVAARATPVISYEAANEIAAGIFRESWELQAISKLITDPNVTDEEIERIIGMVTRSAKEKHGLDIRFVPNDVGIPGLHPWEPGIRGNFGTWDEAANTIWLRKELWKDRQQLLAEVAHEYGAYLLGREFGGKSGIPAVAFRKPDGTLGKASPLGITHSLDGLVRGGGAEPRSGHPNP